MLLSELVAEPNDVPWPIDSAKSGLFTQGVANSRLSPPSMTVTIIIFGFPALTTWTVLSVFRLRITFFFVCAHNNV